MFDGLAGEVQSHERGRAGTVDGERRAGEVEDVGDSVGCDAHGEPRTSPVANHTGGYVGGIGLVISVHEACDKKHHQTLLPCTPRVIVCRYCLISSRLISLTSHQVDTVVPKNLTRNRTKKHACPGPVGVLHGDASVLQRPVDTLEELLLLRVHLLHLDVANAEKLVVEVVVPEKSGYFRQMC